MGSDATLNLRAARTLAANANSSWTEVHADADNYIVVFRHDDDSSEVRRIVVDYAASVLYASIRNDICKNATELLLRVDSDVIVLGRFFETPHLYERLGFKPCQLKSSLTVHADATPVTKGKDKCGEPKPPASLVSEAAPLVKKGKGKCGKPKPPASEAPEVAPPVKKGKCKAAKAKPPASLSPPSSTAPAPSAPSICLTYASEQGGPPASLAPSSAPSVKSVKKEKRKVVDFSPSYVPPSDPSSDSASASSVALTDEGPEASLAPSSAAPASVAFSENEEKETNDSVAPFVNSDDDGWSSSESNCSVPEPKSPPKPKFCGAVAINMTSPVPSGCPPVPSACPPPPVDDKPKARKARCKARCAKPKAPSAPRARGANIIQPEARKKLVKALPDFKLYPTDSGCPSESGDGKDKPKKKAGSKASDSKPSALPVIPLRGANIIQPESRKKLKAALPNFEIVGEDGGAHPWMRSVVNKNVEKELGEIDAVELKCFALTPEGDGIVYTEKDGQCYWTCEIGRELAEELRGSTKDRYPVAINMGTDARHFVKYSDGEVVVNGDAKLVDIVKKGGVKMVSFGKEFDSFAVVYEDGRTDCNKVPKSLEGILKTSDKGTKVEFLSMGVEGEYFVLQEKKNIDGKDPSVKTLVRYGNIHSDKTFKALEECPCDIGKLAFGPSGSFVATN